MTILKNFLELVILKYLSNVENVSFRDIFTELYFLIKLSRAFVSTVKVFLKILNSDVTCQTSEKD